MAKELPPNAAKTCDIIHNHEAKLKRGFSGQHPDASLQQTDITSTDYDKKRFLFNSDISSLHPNALLS
jgi:hypothetical protein